MSIINSNNRGFTLVELSIVIIIIGFLIAGITAGKSLIRQSTINSVINDLTSYNYGLTNFKNRYGTLPGDFNIAWNYWSPNCGGGNQNICNGNGSGEIDSAVNGGHEDLVAWEHLSLAGLLLTKITYTGGYDIGISMPQSNLPSKGGYWLGTSSITLGKTGRTDNAPWPNAGAISPEDASNIDSKIDDGRPGTGSIKSYKSQDRNSDSNICVNAIFYQHPDFENSSYLYQDDTASCYMVYDHVLKSN